MEVLTFNISQRSAALFCACIQLLTCSCSNIQKTGKKINGKTHTHSCMSVLLLCICEAKVIEDWLRFSSPEVVFYRVRITTCSRCILGDRRRKNLKHRRRGGDSVLRKACDTCASTSCQTTLSSSSSQRISVCYLYFIFTIPL